ncbi:MAG TPA: DUF4386 domain-containing protein [Thermoanaerobaculia bacterium]
MRERASEASPQTYATVGGLLYLFIFVFAGLGEFFVRGKLIAWGDPAATAANLQHSELLFRIGLAGEMLTCACDVALALILYVLLRPVSRNVALLSAFFRLTYVAIYGVSKLFEIAALVLLTPTPTLKALEPTQLQALAYAALRLHGLGYGASLLFFGFCCMVFGHLIHRSGYMPRLLGLLLVAAGWSYVAFSLAQILAPAFTAAYLFPWLMLPALPAELGLCLWLLIKGVDVPKWEAATRG